MYLNSKGKVPRQAHVGIPEGVCEEEHGRNGFAGPVSHLYRSHPPTGWVRIEGPLRPRAFLCQFSSSAEPVLMMHSPDVHLYLSSHPETMRYFVRDSDGDAVYFVHQGTGRFETDYGMLSYEPGDYVAIPKGTTYRIHVDAGPARFLLIETPEPIALPEHELLARVFRTLGDATRLRLLETLLELGEATQIDLVEQLGIPQPRASEHLACLAWCGLIEGVRDGRIVT